MSVNFEAARISAYFSHLATRLGRINDLSLAVTAHMVPNAPYFLAALNEIAAVDLVLVKPKSIDDSILPRVRERYTTKVLDRSWTSNSQAVTELLRENLSTSGKVAIVDIGGYFAKSADAIQDDLDGRLVGIMEGTENGACEYEEARPRSVPVWTVARSPLKLPEDYLVGSSVVFSVDSILRKQAQILQTRTACVIGYGRVGSAVAEILRSRGIPTVVHDRNPVKNAEAAAKGFRVYRRLDAALSVSNLVICATGSPQKKALDRSGLAALRNGSVVASVTSSDTVIEEEALKSYKMPIRVSEDIDRYEENSHRYFWLLRKGNAVNFADGAVIGPAIQLIEGEKLAAVHGIGASDATGSGEFSLREVSDLKRELVANIWNEHFLDD